MNTIVDGGLHIITKGLLWRLLTEEFGQAYSDEPEDQQADQLRVKR